MWEKLQEQCPETAKKIELWEQAKAKNEELNSSDSTADAADAEAEEE